jgi:hypothetical protein
MAIDTVRKRASSVGMYWPGADLDRVASLEEYDGIEAGTPVTPSPVGVPELIGPTMRTPAHLLAIGHSGKTLAAGHTTKQHSIRRRGRG